jgi:hypothetical protein
MKTAMQQLISTFHLYQNSGCSLEEHELLSFYIKSAEDLIEKEKEQMFNLIRFMRTNDKMGKSVEDLFNEFYNQNK